MRNELFKKLIREVVQQTISVVQEKHDDFNIDNENVVTINGIVLPSGQKVNADIAIEGRWETEYSQFEVSGYSVEKVVDSQTGQPLEISPELTQVVMAEYSTISDDVYDEINNNPPKAGPYGGPDPDEYDPSDKM